MTMPADPYPDEVETWMAKKEWRIKNEAEWKSYRQKVKVARRNATYYMPYDEEQCSAINGTKSRFYQVPYRYARVVEYKNCPQTYPELPEPHPEPEPDNEHNEKDDKPIVVEGQVNPVRTYTGHFNVDEVPSPREDERPRNKDEK